MKCEEVQEYLQEYSDRRLDTVNSRSVEVHLASCARCAQALTELSESRNLISALRLVEPPDDFADRVMTRIHEANRAPAWWRRFFLPLPVTIPVQATALLLIAVLAIYLLPKEKPSSYPAAMLEDTSPGAVLRLAPEPNGIAPRLAVKPPIPAATEST